MNVLVTAVGSNTAISIIKALRKTDESIRIIGTDSYDPHLSAGFTFCDHFYKVALAKFEEEFISEIAEIVNDHNVDCLIPIHDLEIDVISRFAPRIKTFVAVNTPDIVKKCNDKRLANELASAAGLIVPRAAATDLPEFPLIAKPVEGVSSVGIAIIKNTGEWKTFCASNSLDRYVIQEFITGTEFTVDTYSTYSGNFYGGVTRRRIETKAGISTKGVTVQNQELLDYCERFLNRLNYKGAANLQFIERGGHYYFIEINPRFSGAGILSYESGFNSPYFTVLEATGQTLPPKEALTIRYNLYMTRYWQESFNQQ